MKFTNHKSNIKILRKGDKDFMLTDGVVRSPRAGFEIARECPSNYKEVLDYCILTGLIKPVAYIQDEELMWEKLKG
jgi:hypothetical protein